MRERSFCEIGDFVNTTALGTILFVSALRWYARLAPVAGEKYLKFLLKHGSVCDAKVGWKKLLLA